MVLPSPVGQQHLFSPVQLALSLFAIRALSKLRLFFENLIHSPTFLSFPTVLFCLLFILSKSIVPVSASKSCVLLLF